MYCIISDLNVRHQPAGPQHDDGSEVAHEAEHAHHRQSHAL